MKKMILLLVVLFTFSCKEPQKNKESNQIKYLKGLVDLNNKPFDTSSLEGRRVVLNYWATWCNPCKEEMPSLLESQKALAKENYVFVLVSDETIEEISDFKKNSKYDFLFLKSKKTLLSQGIYALPTTYVYNNKGNKVDEIIGVKDWSSQKMLDKLKRVK